MRTGTPVVVKLGGSLMAGADLDILLDQAIGAARPTVIVCGGGLFADAVRTAQGRLGFSDGLAHRLALDAMSQFAAVIAERRPALALCNSLQAVAMAFERDRQALWHPVALRDGHPAIPETWAVTSDSLAQFVAREIGAAALILVKSADPAAAAAAGGDSGPPLLRLVAAGHLDAAFPAFLAGGSGIVRILGPADHARLGAAIAAPEGDIGFDPLG
ncbi:amino acid kinase family protein [Prosthecodimorpha staleyi]|uniref:Uridylate kinase n=1 Tax=Prosthecodimorpha staleyi TaxID=2840188 RepID=A0A947GCA7_9HYPH|nr:uridylate kinase [Prosthecodimorpha staleyi]MBT9288981.1 uridylate kinase [Prosthecodimorpha staleyi]